MHSLYDEEVRIPGFVVGGSRAFDDAKRSALRTFAGRRTYHADVNATIVDLFGLGAVRAELPFANPRARSLVQKPGWAGDSVTLLATATAVWDDDTVRYGVMIGEHLLVGATGGSWSCFDIAADPEERKPLPAARCGPRMNAATAAFPPL